MGGECGREMGRVREGWENKMREEMRKGEGERREMRGMGKEGTEVNVMCNSQQDLMLTNRG